MVTLDAGDIPNTPAGAIASTTVQAAINELDSEKASATSLTNHISDATDAHAGTAISNTPAGGIAATTVQAALNELDGDKSDALVTYRTLTADHTLDSTDLASLEAGDSLVIEENQAIANDVTVPLNSSVAFPIGSVISIVQKGAGLTSVIADGGVTINTSAGHLNSPGQNSPMTLVKSATDTWYLFNGLPSSSATWQNWGASLTPIGFSSVSVQQSYYQDDGQKVTIWVVIGGTSNATGFTFSLPIALNAAYGATGLVLPCQIQNNGTDALGRIEISGSATLVTVRSTIGTANFTASGGKVCRISFSYQK